MRRVELFELIRADARRGMSVRALADKHRVHRRTVRQAIASSVPPERKTAARARPALTAEITTFIDGVLTADKEVPRKQRHTARRIWHRLGSEHGATLAESTVRAYVAERRRELGVGVEAFVPQHHPDAYQAEVDFYEAAVRFPTVAEKAQVITTRSEASGASLHRAYPSQTQSALFDGIAHGLEFMGGVFEVMRFDNLRQAVARVLEGRRRQEQDRFVAFRSHYGFRSSFTTPGIGGAHEKGGVEGEVGRFRRRWLVPVPQMASYDELNDYLLQCCVHDLDRRIAGRGETVGEALHRERELLSPLPAEHFDVAELGQVRVDTKSRVNVQTNRYSVPVHLVGRLVGIRVNPVEVEVVFGGKVVARHPRLYLRYRERLVLDHYLDLLAERPGAFAGSEALHQERERGEFPATYQQMWERFVGRWGDRDGTRQMVDVLLLHRLHPRAVVAEAVAGSLRLGVSDARAVALLCRHLSDATRPGTPPFEVGELHRYDRALPDVGGYDLLLEGTGR